MLATCQCGQLKVTVPGPTVMVVACHCLACQRRSGSPFGVAVFYPHDQVTVEGEAKRYDRTTDLDGNFENYFCPHCGTTVYFRGSKNAGVTGIAFGAFVDDHAMVPMLSVWEARRRPWVTIPTAMQHYEHGRT